MTEDAPREGADPGAHEPQGPELQRPEPELPEHELLADDLLALVEVTAEHAVVADAPEPGAETGPEPDERPTEWFSIAPGELDELDVDAAAAFAEREHHVTAVVVAHDGEVWLPATLTTLAAQTRPVDGVVGVDTGSLDASAARLRASLGEERVVDVPRGTGFGAAAAAGLEHIDHMVMRPEGGFPDSPVIEWIWLVHDDSAPDADCLQALLDTADRFPDAAVLGPKVLGWHDRRLLLEAGFSVTGSGRRYTGLERREHDQGQHDGVRDVMAVGSAGMLVRRDVWERLDGFDWNLPLFRDDLDFCWRAHRAGERVLVATDAVIHHREASAHGRRPGVQARPHRLDREAAVQVLLAHASPVLAPLRALRLLIASGFTALAYLIGKDVASARDEIAAVWSLITHPRRFASSRGLIHRTSTLPASCVRGLRPSAWSQVRAALEAAVGVATTSSAAPSAAVSAIDAGPVDEEAESMEAGSGALRRVLLRPSVLAGAVLAAFAVIALRGLWWGEGVLQGGALLPAPAGASDLWAQYAQAWHDVGPGSSVPGPPYLVVLWALAIPLAAKAPIAVSAVMLLGIPLAGWSAYFALRGVIASRAVRIWAGFAYALLPALTAATSSGRIGTVIAAFVIPFAARSLVRISRPAGTFRRAAGTALLLAIAMAAAPVTWVIAVIAAIALAVAALRRGGRASLPLVRRLALAVIAPLLALLPWSLHVLAHPVLLLAEPGAPTAAGGMPTPLEALALHPGGPVPAWASACLVVAAVLALLRADRAPRIAAALSLGAVALAIAVVQAALPFTPPSATEPMRMWPGPATLIAGAAAIIACALAADGLRQRFAEASFTLGQPLAAFLAVLVIGAPVVGAVTWFPDAEGALKRGPAEAVPAFVASDATGPQAPRTLVLREDAAGSVTYLLVDGAGPVLGDAEVSPPAQAWAAIDPLVAALASGRGGEEVPALAGYGVRYVLVMSRSSGDLVRTLDSAPGLRRLSAAGGETLWRIAGDTSRARLVTGDSAAAVGVRMDGRLETDPYIDQDVPTSGTLVLGASADSRWTASAIAPDGTETPLEPVTGPGDLAWSSAVAVPAGGTVVARFDSTQRTGWLLLQLLVVLVLAVLALPSRRAEEDFDTGVEVPESATATPGAAAPQVTGPPGARA